MLAKMTVPANADVRLIAATIEEARGDGKEEWDSYSGASFHISHTQAGMVAYNKTPAGTTAEVVDGTIFPVDGFGTVEVDLDQPCTTTKPVEMVAVACVPGLSRNLLSTRKSVGQWGKSLVYNETEDVLRFPGEKSLVFNCFPRKELLSATGVRRTSSQAAALELVAKMTEATRIEVTGQWGPSAHVRRGPR